MKKFIFCLILLFTPLIFIKANSISSINMDIFIDDNGDASVIETWDAYVNSGTEGYHPYFNIGNSKIIMESIIGFKIVISTWFNSLITITSR